MPTNLDYKKIMTDLDEVGFHIIPSVIPEKKADKARGILEQLLKEEATEQSLAAKTQRVGRIAVKHPIFLELMSHPTIVTLWRKYLGDDMVCSTWSGNTVYPGADSFGWHSDYPYWSVQPPWPPGRLAGQTIWLLNDLTEENGATAMLPQSHLKGEPPPPELKNQWIDNGKILTGKRGSAIVMHGACWHTARPNQTDEIRSVLLGMYMRPWFIPQEDMRGQLAELENPSDLVRHLMCANQRTPSNVGANHYAAK